MWLSCSTTWFWRYGLLLLLLVVLENVSDAQQEEKQVLKVCKKLLGVEDPTWKEELDPHAVSNLKSVLRIVRGRYTQGEKMLFNVTPQAQQVQGMSLTVEAVPSRFRDNYELKLTVRIGIWPRRRMVYRGVRGNLPPAPAVDDLLLEGDGLYSASTGDLCMLGCAAKGDCNYQLSLKYPFPTTIQHMGVSGELVSLVERTDPFYFDSLSISSLAGGPYEYTKNDTVQQMCPNLGADVPQEPNLKVWKGENVCQQGWTRQPLRVTWNPECVGNDCSPFGSINSTDLKSKEFYMVPGRMRCDGNLVHGEFTLTQNIWEDGPFGDPSILNGHLFAEGAWDPVEGKLCMLGCQYHGSNEDCAIVITVQFPLTITVTQRAGVIGHVASLRKITKTDDRYFKTFSFQLFHPRLYGARSATVMSEPVYVYSKIEQAKGQCVSPRNANVRKYPGAGDWHDLELQGLRDPQGLNSFSFSLLTVGSQFQTLGRTRVGNTIGEGDAMVKIGEMLNVSYTVSYPFGGLESRFHLDPRISAEGVYNPATGMLCLIGCRSVDLSINLLTGLEGDKDCKVFFSIQLPAVDAWRSQFIGKVQSLRNLGDPLYFKKESLSGMMFSQAMQTVWRQDLEIVISVVMLSLAVIFIFWQLLYSRRYPETLPYISTSMLGLLSLAHMIPLVLNFEALFDKSKMGNPLILSGWPEINEVVVRLTTMSAMLLQLRLLQKAWQSRLVARENGNLSPLIQERRVLYVVLPLYLLGGIIALVVHAVTGFKLVEKGFLWRVNQRGWWWDLKAYAGLLLDFHLFPQVVANVLWGAKEQAPLSKPFYFGMAVVRSLPHIYDLCRTFRFVPTYSDMYMYANPEWDFYSAAWDIVIPCGTLLLASLVYMQQRWGGRCILPARWRSFFEYEKVPSVGP